jgi:hypothetical protein
LAAKGLPAYFRANTLQFTVVIWGRTHLLVSGIYKNNSPFCMKLYTAIFSVRFSLSKISVGDNPRLYPRLHRCTECQNSWSDTLIVLAPKGSDTQLFIFNPSRLCTVSKSLAALGFIVRVVAFMPYHFAVAFKG